MSLEKNTIFASMDFLIFPETSSDKSYFGQNETVWSGVSTSPMHPFCESKDIEVDMLSYSSLNLEREKQKLTSTKVSLARLDSFQEVQSDKFSRLLDWLEAYFVKDEKLSLVDLTPVELKICLMIIRRKMRVRAINLPESTEDLIKELQILFCSNTRQGIKRTEEKNKFIFKHTVVKLKNEIMLERNVSLSLKKAGKELTDHYGMPEGILSNGSMSISRLKTIFRNVNFKQKFLSFTTEPKIEESHFFRMYQSSIRSKLVKIIKKWGSIDESRFESGLKDSIMADYFLKNNQCKLPWTSSEVKSAIQCLLQTIRE